MLIKRGHYKEELSVTGDVTEPTTGWTVKLERAEPQGITLRANDDETPDPREFRLEGAEG